MHKFAIVGSSGTGKSTLARALGDRLNRDGLNIEVIHLDKYYWQAGWQELPKEDWIKLQNDLLERSKQWIMDGTYLSTSAIRLAAADTIVFLDRSRLLCLRRALWRHFRYRRKPRPDFSDECLDKLDWKYIKKVWSFPEEDRPTLLANIQTYGANKAYFHLHSQREINRFLRLFPAQQPVHTKREYIYILFSKVTSITKTLLRNLWDNLGAANPYLPLAENIHCVALLEQIKPH
jgi:adenylate kinase family enzyme